jgi:hypothetical protein
MIKNRAYFLILPELGPFRRIFRLKKRENIAQKLQFGTLAIF